MKSNGRTREFLWQEAALGQRRAGKLETLMVAPIFPKLVREEEEGERPSGAEVR